MARKSMDAWDPFENNSYRSFCCRILVPRLFDVLHKFAANSMFGVINLLLLDTEAPKNICSKDCLEEIQRKPIATFLGQCPKSRLLSCRTL